MTFMAFPASTAALDIGSRFVETARRLGPQPALIHRGKTTTFSDLGCEVELLARGLLRAGLARNERVAVLIPPSRDFFAATFALFRAGATPVLIDPGIGFANMGAALAEAAPDAFVGSAKAHLARVLGRWAPTARLQVVCSTVSFGLRTLGDIRALGDSLGSLPLPMLTGSRAAILFTSGSTGAPKGAVYEHSMFAAQVEILRGMFGVTEGEVSLATFPLFGLFDAALGLTVVIPEMDFTNPGTVDPMAIVAPIQTYGVQQLFGSPALLDSVGRFGQRYAIALPTLKRVMSAGAPVPAKTLRRFAAMLDPDVPIHTPYGATEALPVTSIDSREILNETAVRTARGEGVCVGRPVNGVEVAVIETHEAPIKIWSDSLRVLKGQVGEIAVKGPVVTGEYFRRAEDTAKAKIAAENGFWHRMGDLGYFDDKGRLWLCGRKAHLVKTTNGDLYTDCVEGIFNVHPAVKRTALVGVKTTPVLCVELDPGTTTPNDTLKKELLELGESRAFTKDVRHILFHPSFPVDIRHNTKIFREQLAVWAAHELK